ncbi:unnamed protein product [Litomosoides sigmodontis]|uniref:Uncharacterized protein n=1 Tax=Litomosoides sigmodontis TaxID=42156 RepID=A0A3P6U2C1_LITSI|nr:unnamed protein product [Litomosoides sigmodontis]
MADFWTSDIAQERNDSRPSQKYSNLESSNTCYSSKKRPSFTKNYVSTASNGSCVSKRANERRLNTLTNASMDKAYMRMEAAVTYVSHVTSAQSGSDSGIDNDAPVQTILGRRSLLRHIFRSESSSNAVTDSGSGTTNGASKKNVGREHEVIRLAQCSAFTPLEERKITSSQSAFALSSTSSLLTQCDVDSVQSSSAERPADCSFSKWNWFPGQHQHAVPSLRTSKPGRSTNTIVTQEEAQKLNDSNSHFTVNPKPAIKPKPLTLRRERSDLTAAHVPRFATTRYAEHSAGSGSGASVRCALIPPSTCLDEDTLLKCLEEFKRKRQEAAATVSEPKSKLRQQQQCQRNYHKEASEIDFDNANITLRIRSNDRTDQRRLSVPDLANLAHNSLASSVTGVAATAKALTSKIGRNARTGELRTINEGLVTPVIRRKQYVKDTHANNTTNDWSVGSLLQKSSLTHKKVVKQTEQEHLRNEDRDGEEHIFTRKRGLCLNRIIMSEPSLLLLSSLVVLPWPRRNDVEEIINVSCSSADVGYCACANGTSATLTDFALIALDSREW